MSMGLFKRKNNKYINEVSFKENDLLIYEFESDYKVSTETNLIIDDNDTVLLLFKGYDEVKKQLIKGPFNGKLKEIPNVYNEIVGVWDTGKKDVK